MEAKELTSSHVPALDGARALAVLFVLVAHGLPTQGYPLYVGSPGVILFFVLSGFLITGILQRARKQAEERLYSRNRVLLAFYARRFLRIFPLYYLVLAACFFLGVGETRSSIFWHATYLSNWYTAGLGHWPTAPAHFWSLAVEEQFYLVWPALVLFLPGRLLPYLFLACIPLGTISRLITFHVTGSGVAAHVVTPSCVEALSAGALLAYLSQPLRRRLGQMCLPLGLGLYGLILVLLGCEQGSLFRWTFEDSAYTLVSVWLVERLSQGKAPAVFTCRPVASFGMVSYGIYVMHPFVPSLMARLGYELPRGLPFFVALCVISFVLAFLSWHLYERPLNDLKNAFPYVRREATAREATAIKMPQTTAASDPRRASLLAQMPCSGPGAS